MSTPCAAGGRRVYYLSVKPELYPDLNRYSVFAYADFEVSDNLTVFAQYLHGKTGIFQYNTPRGGFGVPQTVIAQEQLLDMLAAHKIPMLVPPMENHFMGKTPITLK